MPIGSTNTWGILSGYSKPILANSFELGGTALQIGSEITIVVGGFGFLISPLLKMVYSEFFGKNMHYSVIGNAKLNFKNYDATSYQASNLPLFSSNIPFRVPYPDSLFTASIQFLCLGISGYTLSYFFTKYGSSLHDHPKIISPSEEQISNAKKNNYSTALASNSFFILSRIAAITGTSIISMSRTLENLPSLFKDFAIASSKEVPFNKNSLSLYLDQVAKELPIVESTLKKFISSMEPSELEKINQEFPSMGTLTMKFITSLDLSELERASRQGSDKINASYYYLGLSMAVMAVILGFIALKMQQQTMRYKEILVSEEHNKDLLEQQRRQASCEQEEPSERLSGTTQSSASSTYNPGLFPLTEQNVPGQQAKPFSHIRGYDRV